MSRRAVLTAAQRAALLALPADRAELARRYTLSEADLAIIGRRRRPRNRLGLALQLCALRYPGRLLRPGELIPHPTLAFVAEQIGAGPETLVDYAFRENTRYEHSSALQADFGFRPFTGSARAEVEAWLGTRAIEARSGPELAGWLLDEIRRRRAIVPGPSTIERLCADALARAEREVLARLTDGLDPDRARRLDALLEVEPEDRLSRLARLRAPTGAASPATSWTWSNGSAGCGPSASTRSAPDASRPPPAAAVPRGRAGLARSPPGPAPAAPSRPPARHRPRADPAAHRRRHGDAREPGRPDVPRAERRQLEAMREHRRLIDRTVRLSPTSGWRSSRPGSRARTRSPPSSACSTGRRSRRRSARRASSTSGTAATACARPWPTTRSSAPADAARGLHVPRRAGGTTVARRPLVPARARRLGPAPMPGDAPAGFVSRVARPSS